MVKQLGKCLTARSAVTGKVGATVTKLRLGCSSRFATPSAVRPGRISRTSSPSGVPLRLDRFFAAERETELFPFSRFHNTTRPIRSGCQETFLSLRRSGANGLSTGELPCFDIPYQRLTEDYRLARARLLRSQSKTLRAYSPRCSPIQNRECLGEMRVVFRVLWGNTSRSTRCSAILGLASEYGKNCIAVERDVGVSECSLGFGVFLCITRLGYRRERFQGSCGLGNRRDVMSHLHESCSSSWVQLMLPRVVIVIVTNPAVLWRECRVCHGLGRHDRSQRKTIEPIWIGAVRTKTFGYCIPATL